MERSRLVLIVDDNAINLKLARITLQSEGLEVATAGNAEEALAAIRARKPGVILMDIQLPGVDGLTLTRQLKSDPQTADIAVIALTAYAMKGDDRKAYDAGCDGYLPKPIDTRALPKLVLEHLNKAPAPAAPPLLLIIEDDPSYGKLLRLGMTQEGFRVILIDELEQARETIARERPNLIISDRHLKPKGDGMEFCRLLKRDAATRHIPVVLLTGSDPADVRLEPRADGPDLYLLKSPETTSKLVEHVRALLAARPSSTKPR